MYQNELVEFLFLLVCPISNTSGTLSVWMETTLKQARNLGVKWRPLSSEHRAGCWAHVPTTRPRSPSGPPPAEWRSGRWRMKVLLLPLGIDHLGNVYKGLKQTNNGVLNRSSDPKWQPHDVKELKTSFTHSNWRSALAPKWIKFS